MRTPVLTLTLALLLLAAPLQAQTDLAPPDFEGMSQRFETHLRPALEEVLGEAIQTGPVEIATVGTAALSELLLRENRVLFANIIPAGQVDAFIRSTTQALVPGLMGKLDDAKGRVLIQPSALRLLALATATPDLNSQQGLDVLLVHEVVHIYQSRKHKGLMRWFGSPRDLGEMRVRMAVSEGHAQWAAKEVSRKLGLERGFAAFHGMHTKSVPGGSSARAMRDMVAFPYVEGVRFFSYVAKELRSGAVAFKRVFAQVPSTLHEISHPADYLHPRKLVLPDLRKIAGGLRTRAFPASDFQTQIVAAPESVLQGQLASFLSPAETQTAMADFHSSQVLVGGSKKHTGAQRIVALLGFESHRGAESFTAAQRKVLLVKDERYKNPGQLQIKRAKYTPCPLPGVDGVGFLKILRAQGMRIVVRGAVLTRGTLSVELSLINVPGEDMQAVWDLARQILIELAPVLPAAERTRLRADMAALKFAAELYHLERGRWPNSTRDLRALVSRIPSDPWGSAYRLHAAHDGVALESLGPNRKTGGGDDVHSSVLSLD
jgi:hypothetical protein